VGALAGADSDADICVNSSGDGNSLALGGDMLRCLCPKKSVLRSFSWQDEEAVARLPRILTEDTPQAHTSHMTPLPNSLISSRRLEALQTNREMAIHKQQPMKAQHNKEFSNFFSPGTPSYQTIKP
ncbi:hypothetical protein Hamer_G011291, partial [Homarus americanus]